MKCEHKIRVVETRFLDGGWFAWAECLLCRTVRRVRGWSEESAWWMALKKLEAA